MTYRLFAVGLALSYALYYVAIVSQGFKLPG